LNAMRISAKYLCPVRGLAGLNPPEPVRLGQAAGVAKNLGLERLLVPIIEESLLGKARSKVDFLDGLVRALDRVADAGLQVWLIAPAQRILGLDWVPPYLVRALRDPNAPLVFVDGGIRNLWPFDWWADPSTIQKRIMMFREVVSAAQGHPALTGWVILDRAFDWARPELEVADFVLKSFLAEIREQSENVSIYIGLGWMELLNPQTGQALARQVDGLQISGLENSQPDLDVPSDPAGQLLLAAFLGTVAQWLFERPTEVEIGWVLPDTEGGSQHIVEASRRFAQHGVTSVVWLTLIDPESRICSEPPWSLRPGLEQVGLLDQTLEPKESVESCLTEISCGEPRDGANDFIDLSQEEYLAEPNIHLPRLWDHFRES
jgi:hypothetical protein